MIKYTALKEQNRQNLKNMIPLKKPFTLLIEPSSKCNFSCVQCFQNINTENYFTQNSGDMPMELFEKIIEDCKSWPGEKFKVLKLSLFGEPLINKNFPKMLKMINEANIAERIETTSNISLLTEDIAKSMIENELDYLRVSIYAPTQKKHQVITNSKINIEVIYQNLKMLKELKLKYNSQKPFIAVKMLDSKPEDNDLFMEKYQDVSDEIYIDQPHNWIPYEDYDFIDNLYKDSSRDVKLKIEDSNVDREACSMPFFTLAIRTNGDVSPCCIDWIGNTIVSNIKDNNLKDIWYGEKLFEFWKMHLEGRRVENVSCAKCEYLFSEYYIKDDIDGVKLERLD